MCTDPSVAVYDESKYKLVSGNKSKLFKGVVKNDASLIENLVLPMSACCFSDVYLQIKMSKIISNKICVKVTVKTQTQTPAPSHLKQYMKHVHSLLLADDTPQFVRHLLVKTDETPATPDIPDMICVKTHDNRMIMFSDDYVQ